MAQRDIEMAEKMSNYVNCMSTDYEDFVKTMKCSHRTLQQNFTKLCIEWLKSLSEQEYYDDRNEASVLFAKSIKEQLDTVALPYI